MMMSEFPDPDNEEERVASLKTYNILDTAAEVTFDHITQLASLICETPVSLMNFIDEERQWSKAGTGIDTALTELPRDMVFCNQTILHDFLYEIPDTTKDPLFADNPLVKSTYKVRFYAGVPLINPEGFRLGALCVLDMKPKILTDSQKKSLEALGKIAADLLEKKRLMSDLNLLNQVTDIVDCNIFIFNSRTWLCEYADSHALKNTNLTRDEMMKSHFQDLFGDVPPEKLDEMINAIVKKEMPYFFLETKLKNKEGESIPVDFYLTIRKFIKNPDIIVAVQIKKILTAMQDNLNRAQENKNESDQFKTVAHVQKVQQNKKTEKILEEALLNNEFLIYYQPIGNVSKNELSSCEALLRWRDPAGKISLPLNFIQVAEESGLILVIGEWVIEQVASQIAAWKKTHTPVVPVAINLSSQQLKKDKLVNMIKKIVFSKQLVPADFIFELTKSCLVENYSSACIIMEELKSSGFKLALDDFGTGYSSLSYLTKFPLDKIKIDKSFVAEITSNSLSLAVIKTIISLAKNLKLSVVAEGVETHDQLNFLVKYACDEIQGYLISKPVGAEDFEKNFLRKPAMDLKL
jgi:EAL domain-containing protein (putative c-di-GMP-specific phosphodiesterase class I)/PAS domain-containing protein